MQSPAPAYMNSSVLLPAAPTAETEGSATGDSDSGTLVGLREGSMVVFCAVFGDSVARFTLGAGLLFPGASEGSIAE
jgi:hypothetical protein